MAITKIYYDPYTGEIMLKIISPRSIIDTPFISESVFINLYYNRLDGYPDIRADEILEAYKKLLIFKEMRKKLNE